MLSFFGEQCLKDAVVARVKEHQRLDQIIQQVYWDGSKGCAIGCVLHSHEHMAFERQLGLPVFLAYMDEHIFESLSTEDAKHWPLRFIEAVPVGVDLQLVFPRFMHWLLTDPYGITKHANAKTRQIIEMLIAMYARRIDGIPFDRQEAARAAASVASVAAWSAAAAARAAAWSAAEAAAREAASVASVAAWSEAAAWSAAQAARAAARAASVAASVAADKSYIHRQANYLIALLQSYESKPLNTQPCPENIHELVKALNI